MAALTIKKWSHIHIFLLANTLIHTPVFPKKANLIRAGRTFGKTHFIKGFPRGALQEAIQKRPLANSSSNNTMRVLFAPDDNLQKEMIQLIKEEQESIKIAIYLFTNKKIAEALVSAQKRGVKIELIVDGFNADIKHSKINFLTKKGDIPVCKYCAAPGFNGQSDSIMHNKFVIFGKNKNNKKLVWTGSYNFTVRASKKNQENAVISDDPILSEHFEKQFERLKKRCSQPSI